MKIVLSLLVVVVVGLAGTVVQAQCANGVCLQPIRTVASATVRSSAILNREVATARVVQQGPILNRQPDMPQQSCCCQPAPPRYTPQPPQAVGGLEGSAQQTAYAEATYMAATGTRGHVGRTIGSFEGVGWASPGQMPPTCMPPPRSRLRLIADAMVCNRSGCYRVRAWR